MTKSKATFCLFDYIRNTANAEVAAQMAQSTAWRIDTLIQGAARQLFKSVRQDQYTKGVDGLAELASALAEQAFAEQAFNESGGTATGSVVSIKELMVHREAAHELAAELTSLTCDWQGRPRTYAVPDLDDVFFTEVNMVVKPTTKRRVAISVERRAKAYDMTPEETQAQLAKRMKREEARLKDVGMTLQEQAGAVYEMYRLAIGAAIDIEIGQHFHSMVVETQRALIEGAITAAQRAEDYATSSTSISDAEFDDVCMAALKVGKDLKAVLMSPRFKALAQSEAAAAVNVG